MVFNFFLDVEDRANGFKLTDNISCPFWMYYSLQLLSVAFSFFERSPMDSTFSWLNENRWRRLLIEEKVKTWNVEQLTCSLSWLNENRWRRLLMEEKIKTWNVEQLTCSFSWLNENRWRRLLIEDDSQFHHVRAWVLYRTACINSTWCLSPEWFSGSKLSPGHLSVKMVFLNIRDWNFPFLTLSKFARPGQPFPVGLGFASSENSQFHHVRFIDTFFLWILKKKKKTICWLTYFGTNRAQSRLPAFLHILNFCEFVCRKRIVFLNNSFKNN